MTGLLPPYRKQHAEANGRALYAGATAAAGLSHAEVPA